MKRFAREDDKQKLKNLYNICFPGETEFCDRFFDNVWLPDNTILHEADGKIAAMLQMLPLVISDGEKEHSAYYIFAAGTHPDYRSKGIMRELIRHSYEVNREADLCVLIAGEELLKKYYAGLGFQEGFCFEEITVKACDRGIKYIEAADLNIVNKIYEENTQGISHNKRNIDDWSMNLLCSDAAVYMSSDSYFVLEKNNGESRITEAVGKSARNFIGQFLYDNGLDEITAVMPSSMTVSGKHKSLGMYKVIRRSDFTCDCGYLNMLYN